MLSLRNFILILFTICVHGLKVNDSPDITLLSLISPSGYFTNNIVCVAGDNARGSAITFIAPRSAKSIYMDPNAQQLFDKYDCDFEPNSSCSATWSPRKDHKVMSAVTGQHDLDIVTDERWEKFPTNFLHHGIYIFKQELSKIDIGISLLTESKINITFCDVKETNKCYRVFISKTKSALLSCNSKNETEPVNKKFECVELTSNEKEVDVSKLYWSHFKLSISVEGVITIKHQDTLLVSFQVSPLTIQELLLRHISATWKIHDYNYLSLPWNRYLSHTWIPVGPALQSDNTGLVCVELHVAVCSTCSLNLRLEFGPPLAEIHGNPSQDTQKWQLQRLEMKTTQLVKNYNLQVQYFGGTKGFWLIDDIRRCHDQDFNVCDNATYTGSNCDVSCKAAMGTDCSKVTVCEPSNSRNEPKCKCAAGYHGDQCQSECENGFYGSGCKKVCEPCRWFCLKPSGACPWYNKCEPNEPSRGCLIGKNAPRNLNITWIQGRAKIFWDHPKMDKANSVNLFNILIELLETKLITSPYYSFVKTFTVTTTQNHYFFELPDDLPLSSSYRIQVQTNIRKGLLIYNIASIIVSSPAVTPQFTSEVTNGERTNVTQSIIIPAAESNTLTMNSSLYVLVCNSTSTENLSNIKNKLDYQLHSWVKCQGNSWIAATLEPTDKSIDFIVGESKNQSENKQLTPDLPYYIHIIFVNEYEADIKYAITSTVVSDLSSGFNNGLYALLLLLLIVPAIAWFIYRRNKRSTKTKKESVSYHEVSTEPSIPLVNIAERNNAKTKSKNNLKHESLGQEVITGLC